MTNLDKVFSIIQGYQESALLHSIVNNAPYDKRQELLKQYFPGLEKEINSLCRFISYHEFNYDLWKDIGDCLEGNNPKIHGHEDLDLSDYLFGLNQRNRLCWAGVNWEKYFDFCKDKVVLDFGCGGGFYSDLISSVAKKVFCLDKPEVINHIKDKIKLREDNCKLITDIDEIQEPLDVVWVSEVMHGKKPIDIHNILLYTSEMMPDTGLTVINELLPNTPLGKLFDVQMKIHTNGGKLYTMDEVTQFMPEISMIKTTNYHWTIGGKVL